jgi:hypothetical protein
MLYFRSFWQHIGLVAGIGRWIALPAVSIKALMLDGVVVFAHLSTEMGDLDYSFGNMIH